MSNYGLWNLFGPATWSWWLATLALASTYFEWTRRRLTVPFLAGAVSVFLAFAILPTGYWLSEPLEQRFSQVDRPPLDTRYIIVLTGAENLGVSARTERPELSGAAERLTEAVRLARLLPQAELWIVGGVRDSRSTLADIDWAAAFWRDLGISAQRIKMVGGTHDTCENARGVAALGIAGRALLVTSALHMPRAVGCFSAHGVEVSAYPVDYQNDERRRVTELLNGSLLANMQRTDAALHEWIGLAFYRLTGRIRTWFPG